MNMLEYFRDNDRLRHDALAEQKAVQGSMELAARLDVAGELVRFSKGDAFIEQGDEAKDVFFILAGACEILVNGRLVAKRGPTDHVGEMAVIQPTQRRSATCIASEPLIALRVTGPELERIAQEYPSIYRPIAKELSRRLLERNNAMPGYRERIRIFIICSVEALEVARTIQNALEFDPFTVVIWTDGVFRVATYPIEALERELDNSDFAIAIAHADDRTITRGTEWPSPRDNVVFELGLFLGRLGRSRAILMEPRDKEVKLPSDMTGITTIPYSFPDENRDVQAAMAPACNKLRNHINELGPYNG